MAQLSLAIAICQQEPMWLAAIVTFVACCCLQALFSSSQVPVAHGVSEPPFPALVSLTRRKPRDVTTPRRMAQHLAVVLDAPELVLKIAEFVRCPFSLSALLHMVPATALSAPFQTYLALQATTPPTHLWPHVHAHVLLPGSQARLLQLTPIARASSTADVAKLPATTPIMVDAYTTMTTAASWSGHRLVACALTLSSADTEADMLRVASWLETAPQLRSLSLRISSVNFARDGCRALVDAIGASRSLEELALHNDGGDARYTAAFVSALQSLLATAQLVRVRLTSLGLPQRATETALSTALRKCPSLRALELHSMLGFATTFWEEPLPRTLRHLVLHSSSLLRHAGYTDQLIAALAHAQLTHLTLDRKHPMSPEHDTKMAQVLRVLPTLPRLSHVSLTFLSLGPESAAALTAVLPQVRALEALQLKSIAWGGGRSTLERLLVDVAPRCRRLHRVALRNVTVTCPAMWQGCASLRFMCLRGSDGPGPDSGIRVCCANGEKGSCIFADDDLLPWDGALDDNTL
ncbi:hypothetical protein SPRG_09452 [Saprolegnia parasitica CBS 223.65]|uniref:Uncharacterized protein n=1 Tax=Saprolegnia parasitica (strain CBS 223.65) TaxID=695850 RepID=A0A067CEH9_SAPPC|nr:hypothetical protein SPRG_09452 [Saprolegnia parasitica CBS 223.65]KDO25177.1 hypothetical protein SPRG_09452 [Saprolegnia parasitica CBS 223.65]|eukprot:XP_012204043.1 hypothetical protein SPRG_09452 [Saprolegnia parasitica CBS 223.65]